VRRACPRPHELRPRAHAHGPALLARRGGDDVDRPDDRLAGDQQWTFGVVRWRPAADGVCDLRPDAVPPTASATLTPVLRAHARLIAPDENAPSREKSQRSPPMPQRDCGNETMHTPASLCPCPFSPSCAILD